MFSGIVEATSPTLRVNEGDKCLQIIIKKPKHFDDLKIGDSICCNGVCLTVEAFDEESLTFSLGFETLKITGWSQARLAAMTWNLERSLKFGDRIHGHLVSGHVDAVGEVEASFAQGESWLLKIRIPEAVVPYVWKKSSITINGVSLTVNEIVDGTIEVCLIPETLRKTNLQELKAGDQVTLESDYYMKGMLAHAQSTRTH